MQAKAPSAAAIAAADDALRKAGLPDIDTFWVRWRYFRDRSVQAATAKPKRRSR